MANLKGIRDRISSVRSTLKITSAMRLIASAKLHSAQNSMAGMIPYETALRGIFDKLLSSCPNASALLQKYSTSVEDGGKNAATAVVLVTSNQTLCGSFNVNLLKEFENRGYFPDNCVAYAVGKYGYRHLVRAGFRTVDCCHLAGKPQYDDSVALAEELTDGFLKGRFSRVVMIYAHYVSPVSQPVCVKDFLPLKTDAPSFDKEETWQDCIVEPSSDEVLVRILPEILLSGFHTTLLDSATAEHAARSLAMQMASENAENLLGELSLTYNKLRQQAITNEILDLLGGTMN